MISSLSRLFVRLLACGALLTILAVVFLVRDGFARWPTSLYPIPPASSHSWDEVFSRPAPIAIETLVTGFIDMNRCDNLELFNRMLGVRNGQGARQSAAEILRERHLHPNAVFFTHLHPDHTSGVADLPANVDYVFGKQEAGFLGRVAVGSHFSGKPRLKTLDYAGVQRMPPLGPAIDLLGDGSLWAISTPGHTPDHTSFLVNGDPPTLLVGDASHFAWAFEQGIAPRAFTSDGRARAVESLAGLRRFAARYPRVRIVFGHELGRSLD